MPAVLSKVARSPKEVKAEKKMQNANAYLRQVCDFPPNINTRENRVQVMRDCARASEVLGDIAGAASYSIVADEIGRGEDRDPEPEEDEADDPEEKRQTWLHLFELAKALGEPVDDLVERVSNMKFEAEASPGRKCGYCGASAESMKRCRCHLVHYCSVMCQKADWLRHREICTDRPRRGRDRP